MDGYDPERRGEDGMTANGKYAMIVRPDEVSESISKKAMAELDAHGYVRDELHPNVVFVIGGDGTFIYAVHHVIRNVGIAIDQIRFCGIHTGTLGFYTDYKDTDYEQFMADFFSGNMRVVKYPLLQAVYAGGRHHAINEIRIENAARTQVMDVFINGEKFETFRGTGMCVCTQLGSTAYNRSLGGAVIQEGLDFIEMTEISGIHHSKYRSLDAPIILKKDTEIVFKSASFAGALLGCDANVFCLDDVDTVRIHITNSAAIHMLKGREVSYLERLKSLF